ncbi:MAG: 3'-5' exonuclease [Longimicrobiales bacterium]|nr:3'-5' exonuclease [Longimicrobiales bacterium]
MFFDLETGGLDPAKRPIIQIAAIATDKAFNRLAEYERKVLFSEKHCRPDALELTSYDPALWAQEALHPDSVAVEFADFLSQHATVEMVGKKPPHRPYQVARLVGHNAARFDGPFLSAWYKRRGRFVPATCYQPLDTYQLALWHFSMAAGESRPESMRLEDLKEFYAIKVEGEAHDALHDVRATVEVAVHLLGKGEPS